MFDLELMELKRAVFVSTFTTLEVIVVICD